MSLSEEECSDLFDLNNDTLTQDLEVSKAFFIVSLLVSIFSSLLFIFSLFYFNTYRKTTPYLENRNFFLIFTLNLGAFINTQNAALLNVFSRSNYLCFFFFFLGLFGFILSFTSVLFRALSLYYRIKYSTNLIEYQFERMEKGQFLYRPGHTHLLVEEGDIQVNTTEKPPVNLNFRITESLRKVKNYSSRFQSCFMKLFCFQPNQYVPENLQWLQFLASKKAAIRLFLVITGLLVAISLLGYFNRYPNSMNCVGCGGASSVETHLGLQASVAIIGLIVLIWLRNIEDSLGVKKELNLFFLLLTVFYTTAIFLPRYLSDSVKEAEIEGIYDFGLHVSIIGALLHVYMLPYQVYRAKQLSLKSGFTLDGNFDKILADEKGSKAFALYLATLVAVENIYFYKVVQKWKTEFKELAENERENLARFIKGSFFEISSNFVLNIEGNMRIDLVERLNNGDLSADMFDIVEEEVRTILYNLFAGFLSSQFYLAHNKEFV